jgi:hypothetical protein
MNLSRRSLAGYAGGLLAATALAGCATASSGTTVTVSTIEGYAQDVINGVVALTASPSILALLTASQVAAVNAATADAQTVLTQVTSAGTTVLLATAQGWAQQIETDANTVVGLLALVPGIPAAASTIITAIDVLLPILLTSVQIAVPAKAMQGGMSVPQARAILAAPKV